MGYTHYWYRPKTIEQEKFRAIVNDFNKVLPKLNEHLDLADGRGEGKPIINYNEVVFNGRERCGHEQPQLGITWPAKGAGGVAVPYQEQAIDKERWFAGAQLEKRRCGGDCSHETFAFERDMVLREWDTPQKDGDEAGLYFVFCKTAFKPYDLAVITFLIIAKHHLVDNISVHSDGEDEHWFDGKMACQIYLGYGIDDAIVKGVLNCKS